MPRVMQRSHRLKSSWLLNGPLPKLPVRGSAAMRARAAGTTGGIFAVLGIDDEPRPAALGDLVDVAELGRVADQTLRVAAEELGSRERVLLALGDGCRHLLRCHALDSASLELLGLLERRAGLVLVRVVALADRDRPTAFSVRSRLPRPEPPACWALSVAATGISARSAARNGLSMCVSRIEARRQGSGQAGVTLRPGARPVKRRATSGRGWTSGTRASTRRSSRAPNAPPTMSTDGQ